MVASLPLFGRHLPFMHSHGHDEFYSKVDNLDPTEDREAGEEPHGADETNHGVGFFQVWAEDHMFFFFFFFSEFLVLC